jgi:hypothetical protein
VTRGDLLRADAIGHFKELIELDEVVAKGARDGRAAGQIVVDKRLHNLFFETIFEVDDVVRDV